MRELCVRLSLCKRNSEIQAAELAAHWIGCEPKRQQHKNRQIYFPEQTELKLTSSDVGADPYLSAKTEKRR